LNDSRSEVRSGREQKGESEAMIFWILFMMIGTAVTGYMTLTDTDPFSSGLSGYALFAFVLLFTGSLVVFAMHGTRRRTR
jgi:hypothetical protein